MVHSRWEPKTGFAAGPKKFAPPETVVFFEQAFRTPNLILGVPPPFRPRPVFLIVLAPAFFVLGSGLKFGRSLCVRGPPLFPFRPAGWGAPVFLAQGDLDGFPPAKLN